MTGGPRTAPAAGPWVAVVGTRPNYVKVAPLARAAAAQGRELLWIHTGQHTAAALTRAMARDLRMASPAKRLRAPAVGEGRRTRLVTSLQRAFEALDAGLVVTVGDVDSTLAAAVAAHASDRPLVHVEAGLRSFDRRMPEERNRVAVDALSDRLYGTEAAALEHLRAEGIPSSRIRTPGNVMADALLQMRPEISAAGDRLRQRPEGPYGVVTLHRQANVDDPQRLSRWFDALARCARDIPLVFPVHPRTQARWGRKARPKGVKWIEPLPYVSFLALVEGAEVVVTDSGGLQVESALLGTRCVTARPVTEHPLTVELGANRLSGSDPRRLPRAVRETLGAGPLRFRRPRVWDGRAAERIVADWCKGFRRPARLPALPERVWRGA